MVQYLKNYASLHGLPQTVPHNRHDSEPQIVLSSCESKQSVFDTYIPAFQTNGAGCRYKKMSMSMSVNETTHHPCHNLKR